MIECYAIKLNNIYEAPHNLVSTYKGITNFHLLSDKERENYGWYKCELHNAEPTKYQYRSNDPVCYYDNERNVVIASYIIRDFTIDEIKESKYLEIKNIHNEKLYTDVEVEFPDGKAVIQFRDERDRTNISNVSSGAIALVISGNGSTLMKFRTLDNIIRSVSALEMVNIAMTVLNIKQNIVDASWRHKDLIEKLNIVEEVITYDINLGW